MSRKLVFIPYRSVQFNEQFGATSGLCYEVGKMSALNAESTLREARIECEAAVARCLGPYYRCDQCEMNVLEFESSVSRTVELIYAGEGANKELFAAKYSCPTCAIKAKRAEAEQRLLARDERGVISRS